MEAGDRASSADEDSTAPAGAGQARGAEFPDHRADPIPVSRSWVGIVANRSSGCGRGLRLVDRLSAELEKLGIDSRVAWTPTERHELVGNSTLDGSCCCLVAAGGDGTVAALLNERPHLPIAILPAGTENLTAAHFRHRRNVRQLAATIAQGQARSVDLGQADGRRFMLMAGFGFDGDVVSRHHQGRLGTSGGVRPTNRAAYVEPILKSSFSYKFPVITVRIDDPPEEEVLTGTTVFLFNLPRYALGLPFVPAALDDDGWLDLLVFRKPGPFQALYYLWRVLWGNHLNDPGVMYRRVRKVTLTANDSVPVQLDGDPAGVLDPVSTIESGEHRNGPWQVKVLPAAVQMLMPVRPRPQASQAVALATESRSR